MFKLLGDAFVAAAMCALSDRRRRFTADGLPLPKRSSADWKPRRIGVDIPSGPQ
jgi:hypothetical protein